MLLLILLCCYYEAITISSGQAIKKLSNATGIVSISTAGHKEVIQDVRFLDVE